MLPTYISRERGREDNQGKDVLSSSESPKGREGSGGSMGGIQITRWKGHEGMSFHVFAHTDDSSGTNDSWRPRSYSTPNSSDKKIQVFIRYALAPYTADAR